MESLCGVGIDDRLYTVGVGKLSLMQRHCRELHNSVSALIYLFFFTWDLLVHICAAGEGNCLCMDVRGLSYAITFCIYTQGFKCTQDVTPALLFLEGRGRGVITQGNNILLQSSLTNCTVCSPSHVSTNQWYRMLKAKMWGLYTRYIVSIPH